MCEQPILGSIERRGKSYSSEKYREVKALNISRGLIVHGRSLECFLMSRRGLLTLCLICLCVPPPQMNLEDFQGVQLREWIAQDSTRREIKRRFQSFLLTFQVQGRLCQCRAGRVSENAPSLAVVSVSIK